MSWSNPKGFNFRSTQAYVTDGTNETYILFGTNYPTTRTINGESVTFGWESGPSDGRDRSTAAQDVPELAGFNFNQAAAGTNYDFRVDLPVSGTYKVNLALGDASFSNGAWAEILDTTTILTTSGSSSTTTGAADHFYDATDVLRTSGSDWHTNNAQYSAAFSTTIARARIPGGGASPSCLAHLMLTPPSGGVTQPQLMLLGAGN